MRDYDAVQIQVCNNQGMKGKVEMTLVLHANYINDLI
jgi:hypothetical protein